MFRTKLKDGSTKLEGKPLTAYDAINLFFPVNSIKISVDNVNPGTYLTGTTWVAWGAGRAVVGVGSNGTNTYTSEQTFGADTCTLTAAQCGVNTHTHAHTLAAPAHTHAGTTGADGSHLHQPGSPLDSSWGFLAFLQGGTVARRPLSTSGTGSFGFTTTVQADIDYGNATDTVADHTHTIPATAASATALTGSMGAVSGASSATAHDIRQSSIATYIWKRTA